ncbi:MAG TPA: PAS domain S-box protein [Tenuifilaceae bacterium]|nr:PAS domain S-box protein [Tenuifilaceae bacterium]HPQ35345.1 PAS domain S-box protein [Tenuifilaceae bacterium]HRX69125.1 PAS domain S-box protein [Tenuifilaceae bacterium]
MNKKWEESRRRIIGLGETSLKKNYYPELQEKVQELTIALEKAEKSEEKYRAIVELSPEGIVTMSITGYIRTVNKSFLSFTGYHATDFEGKHFLQIPTLIGQDLKTYKSYFSKIVKGNINGVFEFRWKDKQEEIHFGEAHVAFIRTHDEKFILGIIRDITQNKIANQKLIETESRYNLALQAVNEGIWDWNVHEKKVFYDSRYFTLAGYAPNEFPHKFEEWEKRVHPEDIKSTKQQIDNHIFGEVNEFDVEFRFQRKEGSWMWIRARGKVVERDKKGMVVRMIGTHSDITDRKQLEVELLKHKENLEHLVKERTEELAAANEELMAVNEELYNQRNELEETLKKLQEAQKQLVQSEKMASIGVLTSGIAHEINNPINFINSGVVGLELETKEIIEAFKEYAEAYKMLYPNDETGLLQRVGSKYNVEKSVLNIPKLIKAIRTGVDRTINIVKGLRTFSRLDDENKVEANIHDIISSVLTMLYNKYKNRITVETFFCEQNQISCYPGKLGQLFLNIIMNSIQAIEDEGVIILRTEFEGANQRYKISISDNGSGVPKNIMGKIFDPFFTTKPVGQGTGLGLSIVHGIVKDHNGEINVTSKVGEGTTFVIYLPK